MNSQQLMYNGLMRKLLIIGFALFLVVGFLVWKFAPFQSGSGINPNAPATLTIWGLWEDQSYYQPAIDAYKKLHPNITIQYVHQSSLNYRTRVQTQIQNKQGPDILMIHNTWLPMMQKTNALTAAPASVMDSKTFAKTFYPVAKDSLTSNDKVFGLPVGIDGLALFYNEDILRSANVEVPKTWAQFVQAAVKMTVKDSSGTIQTAGAALGTTSNVDNWPDILGLLFVQSPGTDLTNPASGEGPNILKFYTSFIKDPSQKTWDPSLESSTQAFYSGRLALYLAPSWRAYDLRTANPQLKFKVAPVPQLPGGASAWGSFWAFSVSSVSPHPQPAWEFLKFLTSKEMEKAMYQPAANSRLFGEPYSRVDLQSELAQDPISGAFVAQGPLYKSWYLSSRTLDQGINEETIKYFEDAVNSVNQGGDPGSALQTTAKGVGQILQKYSPTNGASK